MSVIKNDTVIKERADRELREQKVCGLDGLVGDLECVIINTEINRHESATQEILNYTGFKFKESFKDNHVKTAVLSCNGSADILVRSHLDKVDAFSRYNQNPRSYLMPHTRMQTFVFNTPNIFEYVEIQHKRGLAFTHRKVQDFDQYYYIETKPSNYTGISFGLIQWKTELRNYRHKKTQDLPMNVKKPDHSYLKDIHELDHVAVRVHSEDRDDAILEFMRYTNYYFDMSIYVENLNSITNVTRCKDAVFALVFTSGIASAEDIAYAGPTEQFIHNYGVRPHHMAFRTENIETVYNELGKHGLEFLVELVGEREQGLKQTFSQMSEYTFMVNEYIHRYDGFEGFFTKNNVTLLTKATENQ